MLGEDLGDEGQVLEENLLFERVRRRRDHDLPARKNGWNEVRERLSRSGACFDEQMAVALEGLADGTRHFELPFALLVPREPPRERRTGAEHVVDRHATA